MNVDLLRQELDEEYHNEQYDTERIKMQNDIVYNLVAASKYNVLEPWLLFTSGPMGAGKTFILRNMIQNGYLPLKCDPVLIDMDETDEV